MGKKISGNKRSSSTNSSSGGGGTREGSTETWSAADHAIRKAKKQRKIDDSDKADERARRSALLTRDSREKREQGKLRLHIKLVQRQIEKLRQRLQAWDDVEEHRLAEEQRQQELAKEQKALEEQAEGGGSKKKKRKVRNGPETWKLKGAARPAWQVYDFDTRYVDPHIKAHEEAKAKAKRIRNLFALYKGKFGNDASTASDNNNENIPPQPHCRDFLALLMQLGNLSVQANQLKTAREAFLECMELESKDPPTTSARCQLMKLYLEANRPESARRLWERLPPDDPSVWIRYSAALIEYVSWKLLDESGSTEESAQALLTKAIQTNVFCAYYLAFWDSFQPVMEHTDEIEGATEEHPLEEAIEYCTSEQGYGAWRGTDGALEWIKGVIVSTLAFREGSRNALSRDDLAWKDKLDTIKAEYMETSSTVGADEAEEGDDDKDEASAGGEDDDNDDEDADEEESVVDGAMFAGMFETAMEMLESSGKLTIALS